MNKQNQQKKTFKKSPYNFVPALSENEIYKPSNTDKISHDLPYSDGLSGRINLTVEACTDLFIGNGKGDQSDIQESCHIDIDGQRQYFVPGSSLKGMVRNVMEILSRCRIKTIESAYLCRDFTTRNYSREVRGNSELKKGWLTIDKATGKANITDCAFSQIYRQDIDINFNSGKSIYDRYLQLKERYRNNYIKDSNQKVTLKFIGDNCRIAHQGRHDDEGTIILSGDIYKKRKEYVFFDADDDSTIYNVDDNLLKHFINGYSNDNDPSDEKHFIPYKTIYDKLGWDKYPVFFHVAEGKVKHFGFTRLYKMNNVKSTHECLPLNSYNTDSIDLAESIFGYTDDDNSLKGRVYFDHLFADGSPAVSGSKSVILQTPRASFTPAYLRGDNYIDPQPQLAGYKRYPVKQSQKSLSDNALGSNKESMVSKIRPLQSGARFTGSIRFHNLRPYELGALISALTFHNTEKVYHSLGGGKPYGYGRVRLSLGGEQTVVSIRANNIWTEHSINQYLQAFEAEVGNPKGTQQYRELVEMSTIHQSVEHHLTYLKLESEYTDKNGKIKKKNEYTEERKNYRRLALYSDIVKHPNN